MSAAEFGVLSRWQFHPQNRLRSCRSISRNPASWSSSSASSAGLEWNEKPSWWQEPWSDASRSAVRSWAPPIPTDLRAPRNLVARRPLTRTETTMPEVVIAGAARTPIGSFNGALSPLPAHRLGEVAIVEAMRRSKVEAQEVSEVHGPDSRRRGGTKPGAAGGHRRRHPVRSDRLRRQSGLRLRAATDGSKPTTEFFLPMFLDE